MSVVGDIVVSLTANTQRFANDLNKGKSLVSGFASSLTKLAGIAGIGFSLSQAFSSIVEETTAAMRATRKLEAVLVATGGAAGVTANHVNDLADALSGTTSFDDDSIVDAAAVLATFDKVGGSSFDRAIKSATDLSEVFGVDLQTAIKQVGKALQSPADGLTALRRIGITFTEQQKEQIEALQESGDLMGAQAIILGELEHKFGGAAEALASPWQQLKNELGNLAEEIGTSLKPAFDDFFRVVKVWAKDLREDLEMIVKGPLRLIQEAREKEADQAAGANLPTGENSHGKLLREMREAQESTSDALGEMFMQMSDGAQQMWEDSRTPLENLQAKFLEIADALDSGFITQDTAGRLVDQLLEEQKKLEENTPEAKMRKKLAEDAKKIKDDARTPLEEFLDQLNEISNLVSSGNLTPSEAAKAVAKARKDLDKEIKPNDAKTVDAVGALQRGSSESLSAINAAIRSANNQPINQVAKNTKATADAAQQTVVGLGLLNQAINELAVVGL